MTTPKKLERRAIARFGRRGEWVKVVVDRRLDLVRVQWKEKNSPRIQTESWADSRENRVHATQYAHGVFERITAGDGGRSSEITLLELWQAFRDTKFPHLRPRTRELYTEYFARWMTYFGEHFAAERTTVPMAAAFRQALTKRGLAVNTVRQTINTVKIVYRWGQAMELLGKNRLALYRFEVAKEDRPESPDEFTRDEFLQILGVLDRAKATQWRPFVALSLCGFQGARQNAVLHINALTDLVDLDGPSPKIIWRARWDKVGREWMQPLRKPSVDAIKVALAWRTKAGYTGPWLFPKGNVRNTDEVYSIGGLWSALRTAEDVAGIAHRKGRGGHGLRRMLAGDVAELTGDPLLAMRSIGDKDPKMAERYIKAREDRIAGAFTALDEQHAARHAQGQNGGPQARKRDENETQPEDRTAAVGAENTQVLTTTGDSDVPHSH